MRLRATQAAGICKDPNAPTFFDKIVSKEVPSDIIYEDDMCIAFRDINPQVSLRNWSTMAVESGSQFVTTSLHEVCRHPYTSLSSPRTRTVLPLCPSWRSGTRCLLGTSSLLLPRCEHRCLPCIASPTTVGSLAHPGSLILPGVFGEVQIDLCLCVSRWQHKRS